MTAVTILLLIGATIRITRLLTTDFVLESIRRRIDRRASSSIRYLIRCDWCMSMYVGAAVFIAGWYGPDTAVLIASAALSASLLAGWASLGETAIEMFASAADRASSSDRIE